MLLRTGHTSACPATDSTSHTECQCEEKRYYLTGFLAVMTGFIEGVIGFSKSLGLLIDGIHGVFDGSGDFVGANAAREAKKDKHRAAHTRERGNKIVALLLFISGLWFAFEAWERYVSGYSPHSRTMIIIAGVALCIGIVRFLIIHRSPFKNETQWGMLRHALADVVVSGGVIVSGLVGEFIPTIGPKIPDLFVSSLSWVYVGILLPIQLWRGQHSHSHTHH